MKYIRVPVFFHIPKNAGTYVYNVSFQFLRSNSFDPLGIWNLEITKNDRLSYRLICKPKDKSRDEKYRKINNAHLRRVDIEDLDLEDLEIYFLEVCDVSFNSCAEDIYKFLPVNVKPYEFLFLREPYERILSLFSYIKSEQSKHEATHKSIENKSFMNYLNSPQLEGSWLIRNFLKIPNETPITEDHFKKTCKILDDMIVCDTKYVDASIKKVLKDCYNLDATFDFGKVFANKTKEKPDIPFDSLDHETRDRFMLQTYWDYKLYKKYVH